MKSDPKLILAAGSRSHKRRKHVGAAFSCDQKVDLAREKT
jgi:hypothetical protein